MKNKDRDDEDNTILYNEKICCETLSTVVFDSVAKRMCVEIYGRHVIWIP